MRIVSASRRTDIPAFYTPWLLRRIRAGYAHAVNPYHGQVYRVPLTPDDVLAFALFTRDPRPLLPHLPALLDAGHHFYAHVTVNGYPRRLEPRAPWLPRAIAAFRRLSEVLGPDAVVWRYDPIVLTPELPEAWHVARFSGIAEALEGATRRCTVSFVDRYRKTERNLQAAGVTPEWEDLPRRNALAARLAEVAAERGIETVACCEDGLVDAGVKPGACLDRDLVSALRPDLEPRLRLAPTREGCGCCESVDLGAYDTCGFGCAYCYATQHPRLGLENVRAHDPGDTVLFRPEALRGVDLTTVEQAPRDADVRRRPEAPPALF